MKIEFDPISRSVRFMKFFILGLIISIFAERAISYLLYAHFQIVIMDFYGWFRYYVDALIGLHSMNMEHHSFWYCFFHDLFEWQNSLALAVMFILAEALGIAADQFFLWYQRTHMQSGNERK